MKAKKEPTPEEQIIEHMRAIRQIAKAQGTKCFMSMTIIDIGDEEGVYYNFFNDYQKTDKGNKLSKTEYIKESDRNLPDSENAKLWNEERGN